MSKKRYTLYLSRPLARKFDEVARIRNGAKSALVEEALRDSLAPKALPGIEEGLARRFDDLHTSAKTVERDMALVTETLSLFVKYFLTITPPLPIAEQEPARILGTGRFEAFVAEIGRRLGSDQRLISEVLEKIALQNPDLFATATVGVATPTKLRVVASGTPRPDTPTDHEDNRHD